MSSKIGVVTASFKAHHIKGKLKAGIGILLSSGELEIVLMDTFSLIGKKEGEVVVRMLGSSGILQIESCWMLNLRSLVEAKI